ncbi:MAG: AsmA-like C-terminal region-containing protein [Glycocaulis sp.]
MLVRIARLALIYLLEAIAVLLALIIFAAAALLWRLASGPVDLDVLAAGLRPALAEALGGDEARYGSATVRYAPDLTALVFDMRAVQVAGAGGEVLAAAERVELAMALDQIIIGRVRPVAITAEGGVFSLRRDAHGEISASLGARSARPGAGPADGALLSRLRRAGISGAELRIEDEISGLSVRFVDTAMTLSLEDGARRLSANARLLAPAGPVPVSLNLETGARFEEVFLAFSTEGLVPASLGPLRGPWALVSRLDAPVDAEIVMDASRQEGLRALQLSLEAGAGALRNPEGSLAITSGAVSASLDAGAGELDIRTLRLDSALARLDLSGRIHDFAGFDNALPSRARYALALGAGGFTLEGVFPGPVEWEEAAAHGVIDLDAREIGFEALTASLLGVEGRFGGALTLSETALGLRPSIAVEGAIEGVITKEAVLALWPVEFALGARDWVSDSILAGQLRNARLRVAIPASAFEAGQLEDEDLSLAFDFSGARVRYISQMTALEGLSGSAELRGSSLSLQGRDGRIGPLAIDTLFVEIPRFVPRGAPARFGGEGRGTLPDFIALLNQPPLELAAGYGLDVDALAGEGSVRFEITRPMLRDVPYEDIGFDVSGRFAGAAGPSGIGEIRFEDGDLAFQADGEGMRVEGEVRVGRSRAQLDWTERFRTGEDQYSTLVRIVSNADVRDLDLAGIPARSYMDGRIGLDAAFTGNGFSFDRHVVLADLTDATLVLPDGLWTKPRGTPAALELVTGRTPEGGLAMERLAMLGEDVDLRGQAVLGPEGQLVSAVLDRIVLGGRADLAAAAHRPDGPDGPLAVQVEGRFFDASPIVSSLLSGSLAGGEGMGAFTLSADIETVQAGAVRYGALSLIMAGDDAGLQSLHFDAVLPRGPLSFALGPDDAGGRSLAIESADAGALLSTLGGFGNVTGGQLSLEGTLPPAGVPGGIHGRMVAAGFRLEGMPLLTRILAAGSLEGLGSLLSGQGLDFERMELGYTLADGMVEMRDGRVAGPALGLTWTGVVDTAGERLNLSGTILPSYGLNSVLGNLPVVGELLTSRRGEGVIGVTFTAEGPFAATRVTANPLSALAPGVFRRIFEGTSALRELDELEARRREEARLRGEALEPAETGPLPEGNDKPDEDETPSGEAEPDAPEADDAEPDEPEPGEADAEPGQP